MSSINILTEAEFVAAFEPELYAGLTDFVPRDWPKDRKILGIAEDENRCWTVRSGEDGRTELVNGHDPDERHYSVITRKPFTEGEHYLVKEDEWKED